MPNVPNQYHLQGGGISVSYYPQGFGPPVEGRGRLIFVYQDAHRSESFYSDGSDVRTVKVRSSPRRAKRKRPGRPRTW